MEPRELLRLNKKIKRRLQIVDKGSYSFLVDSRGRRVDEASLMGLDSLELYYDSLPRGSFFKLGRIFGMRESKIISRNEAEVLLGYDFRTVVDDEDIQAMLKALEGGDGGSRANAYVLGPNQRERDLTRVPVAFYIIPGKVHHSLSTRKD